MYLYMSCQHLTYLLYNDHLDVSASGQFGVQSTDGRSEAVAYTTDLPGWFTVCLLRSVGISLLTLTLLYISLIIVSYLLPFLL